MGFLNTVQNTLNGINFAASEAIVEATGDVVSNLNGNALALFRNEAGTTVTVTMTVAKTVQGLTLAAPALVVAATGKGAIGPFDVNVYNNGSGEVRFDYSGADVTQLYGVVILL